MAQAQRGVPVRSRVAVMLAAALVLTGGCRSYSAVPASSVAAAAEVHVSYAPSREMLVRGAGGAAIPAQVTELHGRAVAKRGDSLDVRVERLYDSNGRRLPVAHGSVVTIPLEGELRVRRLDAGKTVLGALGVTGAALLGLYIACGEFCQ